MELYNGYIKVKELKDNLKVDDILQKYDSTSPLIFGKIELAEDPSLIGKIALFKRVTKVPALERLYIQKQDLIATITNEEYNDIIFSKE